MTIRPLLPSDKTALLAILLLNTPAYFHPDEELDFIHYLDKEIQDYFVVEISGNVVGSGGINYSTDGKTGIISWDLIHPDFQGKGIGRQLLEHRIAHIKTLSGIENISVRTSQQAYKFYGKSGFQLKEVVKDYWSPGYDMYKMILRY